jgi:hypothetical protein
MNIYEVGTGQTQVAIWCFGPVGHLPLGDVMLAQKLALETDEQAALAVANRTGLDSERTRPTVGACSRQLSRSCRRSAITALGSATQLLLRRVGAQTTSREEQSGW